jgi:hypothetical protein
MSVKASAFWYKNGLRKPRGLWPLAASWSLMRAITLAKMGLEQLVPATEVSLPWK